MNETMQNDIIRQAAAMADTAPFIADDFAQALFPKTAVPFNDRMRSSARQYLRDLVSQIENRLCQIATQELESDNESLQAIATGGSGQSFRLLEDSGLLKSSDIVQHLFVKAQQNELAARLLQKISQEDLEATLTRHLDHSDPVIADAAMGLLIAQSRTSGTAGGIAASLNDLPAEMAYALAWPVSAALARSSGGPAGTLQRATERLLSAHDESAGVARKAARLAQLLEQANPENGDAPNPMKDGLFLFLARLARRAGLTSEQIVTFTAEPEMARLVVALRAADCPVRDALAVFFALATGDQILTAATYEETDAERSRALIARWAAPHAFQKAERILADDGLGDRVR